ncbi:hypothetical protein [Deinococcus aquaticus]|uniref:hypothetical protein n=1 Tax=Deinococcus aquaticus TaxID=328692 RepID=UPI003F4850F4
MTILTFWEARRLDAVTWEVTGVLPQRAGSLPVRVTVDRVDLKQCAVIGTDGDTYLLEYSPDGISALALVQADLAEIRAVQS